MGQSWIQSGVTGGGWNGIPIARAAGIYADRETGGRPDARRARLLQELPQDGLVLDLRSNPGGLIRAAKRMLQLFTDRDGRPPIMPTRFSLVASP